MDVGGAGKWVDGCGLRGRKAGECTGEGAGKRMNGCGRGRKAGE